MLKNIFILILLINFGLSVLGDNMKLLSFYTVNYSDKLPLINGKIDDLCWEKAQEYNTYYVYFKTNPEPGKLKTSLRMLWNEKGIFIGIINYDKNIDKIRAKYTTRDSAAMWNDDCAELYFDPYADSVGFTKFTVNALATVADIRQIDAAVKLSNWSASGLEVKTSKNKDSWIIEMFVPWSDLSKVPHAGSVWKFCHVRYAWGTGKFVGVTSSPGGNYNNIGDFGFLYFAGNKQPDMKAIGTILEVRATPPWCLLLGDDLLIYDNNKLVCEKKQQVFETKRQVAANRISQIKELLKNSSDSTVKEEFNEALILFNKYATVQSLTFSDIRKQNDLNSKLNNICWKLKLADMINKIK
jgi:hypothetical protein